MQFLLIIFGILLFLYIYFLSRIYAGLKLISDPKFHSLKKEYVSVIIPFRNERNTILMSLESLSSQTLSKEEYEVIYIDDNSDDNTFSILNEAAKPKNISLIKSPYSNENIAHKKKVLDYAIERANGIIIVTTDADCTHSKNWLETILSTFNNNTAFVAGPVQFNSNYTLFAELQKIEFSSLILVGAGLIGINFPIICNAANLAFRKSVFNELGGYRDNINVSSGDDEFLMQKISKESNYDVKFCFSKSAMTYTEPNKSFIEFYNQRKRWASKGLHYKDWKIVIILITIFLFYFSIPVQFLIGIFLNKIFMASALGNVFLKMTFEYIIIRYGEKHLFDKANFTAFIIAELFHIPYILISSLVGLFGNYKWKGRKVKR
jgi:cellulose synthase/poly-beta-1,6-N-acetylglucosamine synthase-like glycosyltransferase